MPAGTVPHWGERAYTAGYLAASATGTPSSEGTPAAEETEPHKKVNNLWNRWYRSVNKLPWHAYYPTADKFLEGYCRRSGQFAGKWLLLPTVRTVSVIVTVMNEQDTVPGILEQLHRLPLHEIIFVLNGSTDESFEMIRNQSLATIVHFHHPLGHDVGRAIGAKLAQSDILLFLDGDIPVFAEHLVPFIDAVERGMDIALNNICPYIGLFSDRDDVTTVKEFVNMSMERTDLRANSLTAVPHAMSKQAAQTIGYANLAVPPKAQVIAMEKGLKLSSPINVDVITRNRLRKRNVGRNNTVSEMIIGDHIEALTTVLDSKGSRLSFTDQIRNRQRA